MEAVSPLQQVINISSIVSGVGVCFCIWAYQAGVYSLRALSAFVSAGRYLGPPSLYLLLDFTDGRPIILGP